MSIEQNNAKIVSTCGQRLAALKKYVKAKTAVTVDGESMKPADLVAAYQAAVDTRAALIPQRASYKKALAARDSAEVTRQVIDKKLKVWVMNQFGATSQVAEEFGFLPTKVAEKSAETKANAVLKMRATRAARGTKGKRQKEKIKGTTTAPAEPADPAATAPAASPAASAPAATNGAPTGASSSNGVATAH
jgi:hypothetical protein